MKTWKKYLKQILPEAVCFCMGMIVLVQYCSQPPRFSETQEITDQSTLTSFKTAIRSHLSEVEETIDTLISLLTENHFTHAMHDYINERLSKENVNKEVDIQKCDSDRIFLERQK